MITLTDVKAVAKDHYRYITEDQALEIAKEVNGIYPLMKEYRSAYSIIWEFVEEIEVFI